MYAHILVPTDGSEQSEKALRQALEIASTLRSKLTVLTVSQPLHSIAGEPHTVGVMSDEAVAYVHEFLTADLQDRLERAKTMAEKAGIACDVVQVEHGHIHEAIIDTAAAENCDLIAMASHGRRGLSALVLGSETTKVLTHSTVPVLVFR